MDKTFSVGDLIVITKTTEYYSAGAVGEITSSGSSACSVEFKHGRFRTNEDNEWYVHYDEFERIYAQGDQIRVINDIAPHISKGASGIVMAIEDTLSPSFVDVKFDSGIYDASIIDTWRVHFKDIVLVEKYKSETERQSREDRLMSKFAKYL